MNVALCDDEAPELETLRLLVGRYGQGKNLSLSLRCFQSGEELLAAIAQGQSFDIIFLDVIMGSSNGVDIARRLRELRQECSIIFATNSREFAIEGYGVRALQYLLKPIDAAALADALDLAMEAQAAMVPKAVLIKTRQGSHSIPLERILFAESDARVITLHVQAQEELRFYERLDNFELQCQDDRFLRCHKSFLVNLDHVRSIAHGSIIMEAGQTVPVSMSVSRAKEIFASYTAGKI
jgi:two-component system, LytTR family, response regulator LytT